MRQLGQQLRVDGVAHREIDIVHAEHGTGVERPVTDQVAADPERRGIVGQNATEPRNEAAGKRRNEGEAIGVGLNRGNVVGVGHIVVDADGWAWLVVPDAAGRQVGYLHAGAEFRARRNHGVGVVCPPLYGIAVLVKPPGYESSAVSGGAGTLEDAAAGMRITEVETAFHLALGEISERVGFAPATEIEPEIGEHLVVVLEFRSAPHHDIGVEHMRIVRIADVGVTRVHQALGVAALHRAVGGVRLLVLEAEICESVGGERKAEVGRDVQGVAIAFKIGSVFRGDRASLGVVPEREVDYARDGVRTVLRGRSVAQDFHALDRDGRDGGKIGTLRAVGHAIAEKGDDRGAMASLAIDQGEC